MVGPAALTLACCASQLEPSHLRMPGAKMNVGPRMWDMYPMDPVTLEMIARFMFTLAVMGDLWGTASMDFVRSF